MVSPSRAWQQHDQIWPTWAFRISTYFDMCNLFSWAGRVVTRAGCPVQAPPNSAFNLSRLLTAVGQCGSPRQPQTAEAKVDATCGSKTSPCGYKWQPCRGFRGFIDENGGYVWLHGIIERSTMNQWSVLAIWIWYDLMNLSGTILLGACLACLRSRSLFSVSWIVHRHMDPASHV